MAVPVPVRVRLAPSPTGDPHVGTAYIALFNYVFAKRHGGKLILRIEDTDRTRARPSSEQMIMESLRWLGLEWDEGPDRGGPHAPYRQSERQEIFREHANRLIANGHAYRCFCTPDRLAMVREQQQAEGKQTGYDRHCRTMDPADGAKRAAAGEAHVVRLAMPREGVTRFKDELRGELEFDNSRINDQVLVKSDGFPTYHLAAGVDDHLMGISHVIRAEEWISSAPIHVVLNAAFGWQEPKWIHMPLLRNSDRSKISKRKNPTSLSYYRRAGILPQALVNFLGLMGWSFGGDREIFTVPEMVSVFDIKNISLGGPVFDQEKLTWLNQHYMHKMTDMEFVGHLRNEVFTDSYLTALKPLALERMSRFEQFCDNNAFFFSGAIKYEGVPLVPQGKTPEDVRSMLSSLSERLDDLYEWEVPQLKEALDAHKTVVAWKPKDFFMTVRLVVTGRPDSPPLVETIELLGREMVRFRLRNAMTAIK